MPIDPERARLLFQVISSCYERRSLILTTNIEFSKWGTILGDEKLAAAVLALPQNQPNAPLYPAGGAPGSRPGALPHFGRPRYLGPPPRARSTAG